MVFFCYIDESGTPEIPGNTSHYVLAGISIPIAYWKQCESKIHGIKKNMDWQRMKSTRLGLQENISSKAKLRVSI